MNFNIIRLSELNMHAHTPGDTRKNWTILSEQLDVNILVKFFRKLESPLKSIPEKRSHLAPKVRSTNCSSE